MRATELIAKGCTTDWAFKHDVERGGHAGRVLGDMFFPWLSVAGYFEIGNHEGRDASLWATTNAGGTFVTDFTTDARCGAGEWRDCGGVIVGLYFTKNV